MDTKDITTAKDPGLRASMAAMQRAATLARKTAIQTDTHVEQYCRVGENPKRRITAHLGKGFKYIENQSIDSTFQGLFSEINLNSEKLGKNYTERNAKLCTIISRIAAGIAGF